MRNYGYDIALAEMDRIRAKIKDGNATTAERVRYQQLLSHPNLYDQTRTKLQSGLSAASAMGFASGPVPIAPKGPMPGAKQCDDEKKKSKKKYVYKPQSVAATLPYVRPIATIMSRAAGSQERVVFYDMYPAAHLEQAVAKKNSPVQDEYPKTKPYHARVIEPNKGTRATTATTITPIKAPSPSQSSCGQKRVHVPVPVRGQEYPQATKRQKIETQGVAAAAPPSKGILRYAKPSSKPTGTRKQPSLVSKIDPTAFLRAMRASAATRGQQEHILTAFRASSSSSTGERRSAFESLQKRTVQDVKVRAAHSMQSSSSQSIKAAGNGSRSPPTSKPSSPQANVLSPPPVKRISSPPSQKSVSPPVSSSKLIQKPPSPRSVEEEAKMRRLAGMKSTTAMLAQTLPPALVKKAIKSNPNMSTTHLLRRFGNPHRRVVHQMLRDQNEKIIRALKKNQVSRTESDTLPKQGLEEAQAKAVAVASK